jgi:hypothetical protein
MHGIEPGSLNQGTQGVGGKITRMNAAQGTFLRFPNTNGGANGLDNDGISHAASIAYASSC